MLLFTIFFSWGMEKETGIEQDREIRPLKELVLAKIVKWSASPNNQEIVTVIKFQKDLPAELDGKLKERVLKKNIGVIENFFKEPAKIEARLMWENEILKGGKNNIPALQLKEITSSPNGDWYIQASDIKTLKENNKLVTIYDKADNAVKTLKISYGNYANREVKEIIPITKKDTEHDKIICSTCLRLNKNSKENTLDCFDIETNHELYYLIENILGINQDESILATYNLFAKKIFIRRLGDSYCYAKIKCEPMPNYIKSGHWNNELKISAAGDYLVVGIEPFLRVYDTKKGNLMYEKLDILIKGFCIREDGECIAILNFDTIMLLNPYTKNVIAKSHTFERPATCDMTDSFVRPALHLVKFSGESHLIALGKEEQINFSRGDSCDYTGKFLIDCENNEIIAHNFIYSDEEPFLYQKIGATFSFRELCSLLVFIRKYNEWLKPESATKGIRKKFSFLQIILMGTQKKFSQSIYWNYLATCMQQMFPEKTKCIVC